KRTQALRKAALYPEVFKKFYENYTDRKLPSPEMLGKIAVSDYGVPQEHAAEFSRILIENGRFTGLLRDIGGSPHVIFDLTFEPNVTTQQEEEKGKGSKEEVLSDNKLEEDQERVAAVSPQPTTPQPSIGDEPPKAIF